MDGKRYNRYVDDFINSHRYINCNSAICRNCHEMNIHIAKGLLTECTHLIQSFFAASDFSFEKCMELQRKYDRSEPLPPSIEHHAGRDIKAPPLSFGCNFTQEQMTGIVSCTNTYHLFYVSEVCIEDMEALFSCKKGFHIRVNNLRHVVILSMRYSKTPSSNPAGSPFWIKGSSCNPRTAHGSFPLPVFHRHSPLSETTRHRSSAE